MLRKPLSLPIPAAQRDRRQVLLCHLLETIIPDGYHLAVKIAADPPDGLVVLIGKLHGVILVPVTTYISCTAEGRDVARTPLPASRPLDIPRHCCRPTGEQKHKTDFPHQTFGHSGLSSFVAYYQVNVQTMGRK